jgi:hypothetical protein
MPYLLLWHPRVPQEVDIPMDLEIVGYTRRWSVQDVQTRWRVTGVTRRYQVLAVAKRWVIQETRRIFRRE